jgi:hypothetical protein
MKYEVTYKNGKKETLKDTELPKFSPNFNKMIKTIKIGESMYEITDMVDIKRIE